MYGGNEGIMPGILQLGTTYQMGRSVLYVEVFFFFLLHLSIGKPYGDGAYRMMAICLRTMCNTSLSCADKRQSFCG